MNSPDAPALDATPPAAPRTAAIERGVGWWTDAWALFMRSALMWTVLGLILVVGLTVVSMVPVLGTVAGALLTPVLVGSWMLAARKVEGGGALEVADLFTCFQGPRFSALLLQGVALLVATVAMMFIAGALGIGAVMGMAAGGNSHAMAGMMAAMGAGFAALLVVLVFGALISVVLWFGPALVVFRNLPAIDALRLSAVAVLKNWLPFLVYSVLGLVAALVASIPLGLGWLVLVPVTLLSGYVSYKDVFEG